MIGHTVSHYRILSEIGAGGMGVVFRAKDLRLGREVALKFLSERLTRDAQAIERFEQEARAASALDHPNICTIYEIGEHEGKPFIAMQLLEGQTLKNKMGAAPPESEEILKIAVQVAEALAAAHSKAIVHRDIKPSNIFLTRTNLVKILDFGLAKLPAFTVDDHAATGDAPLESARGTLPYMAPEQLLGLEIDARTDLYAFGVTLYELCTGQRPFPEQLGSALVNDILHRAPAPPSAANPQLPRGLDRLILRCLEKKPANRFASAHEVLAELRRILEPVHENLSIAVLYFENLSGAKEDEYFRDGMTEDIITELSKIRTLHVFPRSAVLTFRNQASTAAAVGHQLGAAFVLDGSLRRSGTVVRITSQLVDAASGHTVWAERFDRELKDIFEVQDQIARSISQALRITLSPQEEKALEQKPTASHEAYDFYLRGRALARRSTHADLEFAIEMYERAIALDQRFARAWGGMAIACALVYDWHEKDQAWLDRARHAAESAMQMEPGLPEALAAQARLLWSQRKYAEAAQVAREAIARKPDCENAYWTLGQAYFASDRWEEAAALTERALNASGHDYNVYVPFLMALERLGRNAEVQDLRKRQQVALERHLEQVPEDVRAHILLANNQAFLHNRDAALRHMKIAVSLRPQDSNVLYNAACTFGIFGQATEALEALRQAIAVGFDALDYAARDPDLACIRDNPEFQRLLHHKQAEANAASR